MKSIKVLKKMRLKNPVLVAAWPGMGDVALKAAMYLRDKLNAAPIAELDPGEYFHPSGVSVDKSLISLPHYPVGKFYAAKNSASGSDLVIFVSEAQPFVEKSYFYAQEIIQFAASLKIKTVYTFAAMPLPIEHTQMPQVHVASTEKQTLKAFERAGVRPMTSGQISGLNGLILGVAKENGLEGVCLLGEIPLYTVQIENPMASMAVLKALSEALRLSFDLADLRRHADRIIEEIEHLIDYLKNPGEEEVKPIDEKDVDVFRKGLAGFSSLPESARDRIESLFRLARRDLSRATDLKKELDKWNVYDQYEDTFLDLFKKSPKKDN